jgi:hypothetical protein
MAGAAHLGAAVVASGALVLGSLAVAAPAGAAPGRVVSAGASHRVKFSYLFVTRGSHKDRTFNQLLGINSDGKIVGYFGSGAAGHPNKGYTVRPPYGQSDFRSENFPGSKQTQVIGLNNHGVTVGFFSTQNKKNLKDNNIGFWAHNRHFHPVVFPTASQSSPPVNQLLGVNDRRRAVGFYENAANHLRAFRFNIRTGNFHRVRIPGATDVIATGINNKGSISGAFLDSTGVHGFFLRHTGRLFILNAPGATQTQAFGVNKHGEVVGAYMVGSATHGFTWTRQQGFAAPVDDPHGIGTTTINGVNKQGVLVGFYVNSAGNTKGMIADPVPAPQP